MNCRSCGNFSKYSFLDLGHSILTLDSITGNVIENINIEYESVKWSSSLKNNTITTPMHEFLHHALWATIKKLHLFHILAESFLQ